MRFLLFCSTLLFSVSLEAEPASDAWDSPGAANPILPGYFADPDIVTYQGRHYVYATLDPWGGETLGCWVSGDFKNWEYHVLNWPTKAECTSEKSGGAMVWAPTVGTGYDGRFYMYISVGSEIWAGVADHPLGPWKNALEDRPMIPFDWHPDYHMIDADLFEDEDGSRYLYWGSGWNWENGRCYAVKLDQSMTGFVGEPQVVTPTNYFEAPVVFRSEDRYYMLYSDGITIKDTYQIHYAIAESPLGPFEEAENSPLLVTNHERNIVSPGHNTVAQVDGKWYLVYHRQGIPFVEGEANRQVCVDPFEIGESGLIQFSGATHEGPSLIQARAEGSLDLRSLVASTSSEQGSLMALFDDNFATLWKPGDSDEAEVTIDLGEAVTLSALQVFPEFPWKKYSYELLVSKDGGNWVKVAPVESFDVMKSPIQYDLEGEFRYLRFMDSQRDRDNLGIWDLRVFP